MSSVLSEDRVGYNFGSVLLGRLVRVVVRYQADDARALVIWRLVLLLGSGLGKFFGLGLCWRLFSKLPFLLLTFHSRCLDWLLHLVFFL